MAVKLNHTIVFARDKRVSAAFLADMLGLAAPVAAGPFMLVHSDNDVTLSYLEVEGEVSPQHFAFLVGEEDFDGIFARVQGRAMPYWADPYRHRPGEIDTARGGRRIYFDDPNGHYIEIMTRRSHEG